MPPQTPTERLEALRDTLLAGMDDATGSGLASLSREYRAVLAELEKAGNSKVVSRVDDLAAKRSARIAEAKGPDSSAVRERGGGPGGD